MFRFEKEQSVWDFNGTKIGGQPGEYPTVLGASIFYNKHEIVKNDHTGEIDKDTAEGLWNRCLELTDLTGIPFFIQIIGEFGEAFESYIDWFTSIDNKTAFLMDSSAPAALAHATRYVTEVGVADRAIYNSINGSITQENIDVLAASRRRRRDRARVQPGRPVGRGAPEGAERGRRRRPGEGYDPDRRRGRDHPPDPRHGRDTPRARLGRVGTARSSPARRSTATPRAARTIT